MKRTFTCYQCGNPTAYDESLGAEVDGAWRDVCQACYDDIVKTCQVCGDGDVMPKDVSDFILVKTELGDTCQRPPGIYRVMDRPFLSIPVVGGGSMTNYAVRFVDRLPKPDREYEISGHVCERCARGYRRKWRAAYRRSPSKVKLFDRRMWEIEREHTQTTILANPNMLRDLECDPDEWSRWADLKQLYDLPEGLPTYHEWVFVDHAGVRVYSCYGPGDSAWLTLRPDPKYRFCAHTGEGFTFDASGLPTWRRDGENYRYDHAREDRRAVIEAIDRGILTQDGVRLPVAAEPGR